MLDLRYWMRFWRLEKNQLAIMNSNPWSVKTTQFYSRTRIFYNLQQPPLPLMTPLIPILGSEINEHRERGGPRAKAQITISSLLSSPATKIVAGFLVFHRSGPFCCCWLGTNIERLFFHRFIAAYGWVTPFLLFDWLFALCTLEFLDHHHFHDLMSISIMISLF